jgi:uncharacterized protein (DUF305 family)
MLVPRILTLGLSLALGACGESPERKDSELAFAESAAEPMSHELGPFFHAETEMNDRMLGAVGTSAADSWVRMMVEHHKGGVAMAQILLDRRPTEPAAQAAHRTIGVLTGEMVTLEELIASGKPNYEEAGIYLPAIDEMHGAMMAVQSTDATESWIPKMIRYHRGALEMTEVLLKRDDVPIEIGRAARMTKRSQTAEIEKLEEMLPASESRGG